MISCSQAPAWRGQSGCGYMRGIRDPPAEARGVYVVGDVGRAEDSAGLAQHLPPHTRDESAAAQVLLQSGEEEARRMGARSELLA